MKFTTFIKFIIIIMTITILFGFVIATISLYPTFYEVLFWILVVCGIFYLTIWNVKE